MVAIAMVGEKSKGSAGARGPLPEELKARNVFLYVVYEDATMECGGSYLLAPATALLESFYAQGGVCGDEWNYPIALIEIRGAPLPPEMIGDWGDVSPQEICEALQSWARANGARVKCFEIRPM